MKTTIEMAREAAGDDWGLFQEFMPEIHRLAELVRADERARMAEQPAQQEPEFFTHCVDQLYDWSEWVCPDPKGYLMKCCDCGLVHEAEFGVVRYKSETEREDCDMVDDPNLQAVFRMRRSEQWSPADMAHRAGGLTMEQPAQQTCNCRWEGEVQVQQCTLHEAHIAAIHEWAERAKVAEAKLKEQPAQQEPVAWMHTMIDDVVIGHRPADIARHPDRWTPLYTAPSPCPTCEALALTVMMDQTAHDTPPAQRTWVGLTDEEIAQGCKESWVTEQAWQSAVWWAEARLKEKNT